MVIFATLGPEGSNHELVTQRYIAFHNLRHASIRLFTDFDAAFQALFDGHVHHIIQVAVHPSVTSTVAKYRGKAFLIDAFIAPSKPMAVLTRATVDTPSTLGLQIATREYIDTSRWHTLIPEISIATVAQGLLAGKYDSGITSLDVMDAHPGVFRLDELIGVVDDAWLVYGCERTCWNHLLAWPESPAGALFRRRDGKGSGGSR
jgi:hypothetical protein